MKNTIEHKLTIYIPTYNRSELLKQTLEQLCKSPVRDCCITILDNKSTDNTVELVKSFKPFFSNLQVVTHPFNLGSGSANYMQYIEHCSSEYLWILADDDVYDFSNFDDVKEKIIEGNVNLIQVGAHNDGEWNWGIMDSPKELEKKGYSYFKYSSFLPCTIFKFSYMSKYIKDAFDFIHFMYPHMPSLVDAYDKELPIYVSKKRIVTAMIGCQRYSFYVCFRGFVVLTSYLSDRKSKRAILEDFIHGSYPLWLKSLFFICLYRNEFDIALPKKILWDIMYPMEKIAWFLFYIPMRIKAHSYRK